MSAHHVFIHAILAFLLFPLLALTAQAAPITVTSPTPGQVIVAGSNAPLAATVNLPADKVKKVEFFRNGYRIASLTTPTSSTATSTTWTHTWVKPAANTWLITAEVTDTAGTVTESAQVRLEVDKPPTVKLVSPKAGATYKAPASVFLDVEASDPDGSIARVEFWQGTTQLGQATGYTFEYTWKNVPAGTYSLFARAYDDFGLYADTPPVSITVTGSTPPPPTPTTVTLTQPANNASITLPATLNLAASVSGTASIASVAFYDGTTLIGSDSSSPYAVEWVTPTPGTHTLTAKAIDSAGVVTSSAPVTVTVKAGEVQGIFFIHADHLGTPRLIADEQQKTVWRWDNDEPFGDNLPDEDPGKTGQRFEFNLRFPGQYFDKETGLSYNYYRDYDPSTGRYVQSDPIGLEGGVNTFQYTFGNPLSYSDPLGLDPPGGPYTAGPWRPRPIKPLNGVDPYWPWQPPAPPQCRVVCKVKKKMCVPIPGTPFSLETEESGGPQSGASSYVGLRVGGASYQSSTECCLECGSPISGPVIKASATAGAGHGVTGSISLGHSGISMCGGIASGNITGLSLPSPGMGWKE